MKSLKTHADRLGLGWSLAGLLVLSFSVQAGALDFDKELKRQNYMRVEILERGSLKPSQAKHLPALDASELEDDYKVELIPVKRDKSS